MNYYLRYHFLLEDFQRIQHIMDAIQGNPSAVKPEKKFYVSLKMFLQ